MEWLQNNQSWYWISGKPGSGKSTLMKYLVDSISKLDIYEKRTPIILYCWFWEAGSPFQHNLLGGLRFLLWQLLHCSMAKEIAESIHLSGGSSAFAWTKSRLMDNIRTSIRTCLDKHETMLIFLDGLDECTSEGVKILDIAEQLSKEFSHLKICVSSRPEQTHVDAFKHLPALRLQDLNRHDIEGYIDDKFFADARIGELTRNMHGDALKNFRADFYQRTEGVFLWATLATQSLLRGLSNRDSWETLTERLECLPSEIDDMYSFILARAGQDSILYQGLMAKQLKLIYDYEMNILDFCLAMNDGIRKQYLTSPLDLTVEKVRQDLEFWTMRDKINAQSAGLLMVNDDGGYGSSASSCLLHVDLVFVRFVHRTARTYITDTKSGIELMSRCHLSEQDVDTIRHEVSWVTKFAMAAILGDTPWVPCIGRRINLPSRREPSLLSLELFQHLCETLLANNPIKLAQYNGRQVEMSRLGFMLGNTNEFPLRVSGRIDYCRL